MATYNSLVILATAVFLLIGSAAAEDVPDDCGIAVYWGQNNGSEGSLQDVCNTNYYKYVSIGLLTIFGPDSTNLTIGTHCNPSVGGCTYLGEEIKHCQSKGIKVLLSIAGGFTENNEPESASKLIDYLAKTFLKPSGSNSIPFGDGALDGFDLAVTKGSPCYYYILAQGLKVDNKAYLTASPGCSMKSPLNLAMRSSLFDKIWVRFFDDSSCDYSSGIENMVSTWNNWTTATSPTSRLLASLPASTDAAQTGYISPEILENKILPEITKSDRYGGVAIWNRYYDAISRYTQNIASAVCRNTNTAKDSFISQVVV